MSEPSRRAYQASGVQIDRDAGLVHRNGDEFPLRHKSHRLLIHLIDHRVAPVTKEDLIRHVWEGAAISDDTLVNCVQEIRKALGDDARNPIFIRTMPKTGYWFVAPLEEPPPPVQPVQPVQSVQPPPTPTPRRWQRWTFVALASALSVFAGWKILAPAPASNYWQESSWWTFDDPAAAPLPPGISTVPGISGMALRFSGSESVPSGVASPGMPLGDAPRTIMAWVKTAPNPADTTVILNYGATHPDTPFDSVRLGIHESGKPGLFYARSSLLASTRIDDARWHHVAAVFEGPSRRAAIFVDGAEDAAGLLPDASLQIAPSNRWSIGRTIWGSTPFRGDIDDVRVYSRTMNAPELKALIRCLTAPADLAGGHGFVPIFNANTAIDPPAPGESSARIRNTGMDLGGVSVVRREPGCPIRSIIAANMGQDITIEADVRTGGNATNQITEAGPYFRSRPSAPSDGIVGGTSAGFWVQLRSNGQIRVRRLNPSTTIAFTPPNPSFDPNAFHRLSATAKGDTLTVTLNGQVPTFDQAGVNVTQVRLAPEWENLSPKGKNRGAAGIAFGAESNRGHATGQQARNLHIN